MPPRRNPLLPFALGLSLALVAGVSLYLLWPPRLALPPLPFWEEEGTENAVLVFVVGSADRVEIVHAAIDPASVVHRAPRAFALGERGITPRRIVAADYADVGPLVVDMGWIDASLEIANPPRYERRRDRRNRSPAARPAEDGLDLAALAVKPTLTLPEALALLDSGAL